MNSKLSIVDISLEDISCEAVVKWAVATLLMSSSITFTAPKRNKYIYIVWINTILVAGLNAHRNVLKFLIRPWAENLANYRIFHCIPPFFLRDQYPEFVHGQLSSLMHHQL